MNDLIILTASYNRAHTLPELYQSLVKQSENAFTWMIIDDGSIDNTRNIVDNMILDDKINILYFYQENGGKARALNKGFELCLSNKIVAVVDSDDSLKKDAVKIILNYYNNYCNDSTVGALFFHYATPEGDVLKPNGKIIDSDKKLSRYEYNKLYKANDGCICYFNIIYKKYHYPEFESEKYVGPTVIQMEMADKYKILFSKKIIGTADYLDGGLTKNGRLLRLNNPKGMLYYSKLMISSKSQFKIRLKYAISIWPYANRAGYSYFDILKIFNKPILLSSTYIFGQILSGVWKKKYEDN